MPFLRHCAVLSKTVILKITKGFETRGDYSRRVEVETEEVDWAS
jgi:hypothetical protein